MKAIREYGFIYVLVGTQRVSDQGQAFLQNILVHGDAQIVLEYMRNIIFARVKLAGKSIQRQLLINVFLYIGQYAFVQCIGLLDLERIFRLIYDPAYSQNKLIDIEGDHGIASVSVRVDLLYKGQHLGLDYIEINPLKMADICIFIATVAYDISVIRRCGYKASGKASAYPENHPLIC